MRAVCAGVLAAYITIGAVAGARAQEIAIVAPEPPIPHSRSMVVYGPVEPPPAFKVFCKEMPDECVSRLSPRKFDESPRRLEELDEVNRRVNHTISPQTDIEHYGIEDYWTISKDGKGDCEDYALLKRHLLVSMGWPTGALLMTVVRAENDEGHAVLTARTDSGDLILDNRADEIKPWYQTAYKFKMRQSPQDPRIWLDLDPADDALPAPIAELELLFGLGRQLPNGQGR
jgi:predicted transglutaminase-like cysteine proteinase